MLKKMPKIVELNIPVSLKDVLIKWAHQTGHEGRKTSDEKQEALYVKALEALFVEFSLSFEKYKEEDFVRIFRFFKDAGLIKRLSTESSVYEHFLKLEAQIE